MTDTRIESWIDERKRIHAAAELFTESSPMSYDLSKRNEYELYEKRVKSNQEFILDAHNVTVPALVAMVEAVLGQHRPVEVEPSDTICGGCSNRLPNGRYMPIVEFPCPTVRALEAVIGDE